MNLVSEARSIASELVALRRRLHRIPEIGLELPKTQAEVLAALDGLPLEISTGKHVSSVTAVLRGAKPGPVVLLRGDMDALPITEAVDVDFVSQHDGVMHACGHDLHTAGLVGAARLLSAHQDALAGDVVFMFQPGEEGYDGAGHMLTEGVLHAAGRPVDAAFGLHVWSGTYPNGVFTARPGPMMAASDGLFVTVKGAGGHGSTPHVTRDPIPAACEMVTALQTLVTRRFNTFDPVVLTVGEFHGGNQRNIIPDTATFSATVRSFDPKVREQLASETVRLCEHLGQAYGLEVEANYEYEYPALINDASAARFVADTVTDLFGGDRYQHMDNPQMGAEDFSRILNEVPGAYVFLGACCSDDPASAPSNHSPRSAFDDDVVSDGAALLAELALRHCTGSSA